MFYALRWSQSHYIELSQQYNRAHSCSICQIPSTSRAYNMPPTHHLDASKLTYTYTTTPRHVPDNTTTSSSTICTDHMIPATWTTSWSTPELRPYGPLTLLPTASCLHYATECFEGLKAYRGPRRQAACLSDRT